MFIKARWELDKHAKNHTENKLSSHHKECFDKSQQRELDNEEYTKKPYSCDICQKGFNVSRSLNRHMLFSHSISNYAVEKKHVCNVCGKRYIELKINKELLLIY